MSSLKIALGVGLVLVAITIGVVLSRSPLTVVGTNSVPAREAVAYTHGNDGGCQETGRLQRGISAIRVSLSANIGPRVSLEVLTGSRVLTRGEQPAGWGITETVTVPVRRVSHAVRNALICTTIGPVFEQVQINGTPVKSSPRGRNVDGVELRMEYLRPGAESWLALAPSISRRLGLGHAAAGTWIVFLVLALTVAVATLAARLTLRELR